jgi:DMSO/TMAO reductase YedYZ molybdopterin-dependent catalytic subunit
VALAPEAVRRSARKGGGGWRWALAGTAAGLLMVACMFVVRVLTGAPTLPELFEDQVLALVPGPLFSFVLDRLQFAAKPVLLVGLALTAVPLGAVLGWLYGTILRRQNWPNRIGVVGGIGYGLILWLVLEATVAAWGDGLPAAINSAGLLLASAQTFGMSLVLLARLLDVKASEAPVDVRRRVVVFGGVTTGALVLAGGGLARMLALNTEQATGEPAALETGATAHITAPPTPSDEASASVSNGDAPPVRIPNGVAEEITPTEAFYVVSKNFNDPRVSADNWSLDISGLIDQPRHLSYHEILELPTVSQYTTFECISNTLGGKLMSNAYWTGIPLSQLLTSAGVQPQARAVTLRSADNYYESYPLELVRSDGVLLAHTMNGAPLPDKHGFPLRLVLPGRYGMKSPKWIVKIEVVADRIDGYWVRRGWDREAAVQTVARIDTPADNANVTGPRLGIGGVAFAGDRGISRVEASLDAGATWRDARTRPSLAPTTWVQWAVDWEDILPGSYTVLARATDGSGALQASDEHEPLSKGATGYHRAHIDVLPGA